MACAELLERLCGGSGRAYLLLLFVPGKDLILTTLLLEQKFTMLVTRTQVSCSLPL